ncbi:FAD dependent oxidoreductase [Coprinopsis sp. MPI-PUGE-AT-0042]|nr:FAD dependent oxidoreductase [Coprinopsis sp. MPI-PUGE-AT-0042]
MAKPTDKIVILGCGCFGASTAYHLLQRGFKDVTILDKSQILPAPDAASNDINRIVRSSYADSFYSQLALEAIREWKKETEWIDTYHESGVVVLGFPAKLSNASAENRPTGEHIPYAEAALENDRQLGARVVPLKGTKDFVSVFPPLVSLASFENKTGYLNRDGGWADAGQGLSLMIEKVKSLGGKVLAGKPFKELVTDGGRCTKVLCYDGSEHEADHVVVATGSWTPSLFKDSLGLKDIFLATGQCVAMMQLSPEEGDKYRDCPVVLDFDTGFYVFPPNADNILKMAIHSAGFTHTVNNVSTPRTAVSHPSDGAAIPKVQLEQMRESLAGIYPEFKDKAFSTTRLCWYNDSPDGEWVISKHPSVEGLMLATAGSGHGYKFLPVIGRLVADLLEDKLNPPTVARFLFGRAVLHEDASRVGRPQELDLKSLWTPEGLP